MHKFMALFAMLLSLGGCVIRCPPSQIRVVTGIHIAATQDGSTIQKTLTDSAAMHRVLTYLRILDPYITAELEPDTFRTDRYEITVEYSDGNRTVYRQLYDEYLQIDDGDWKKIDPAHGGNLLSIVSELPG